MAFSDDYDKVFPALKKDGYEGIELLIRDPATVDTEKLDCYLVDYGLKVAAIGTTPMQKSDKLFLLSENADVRAEARKRCSGLIRLCAKYRAVALIGKYRGMLDNEKPGCTMADLENVMTSVCAEAAKAGVTVAIEPQNPTNINNINTIDDAISFIVKMGLDNLGINADIFHMDITEDDICESIKKAARYIDFIHMSDSERKVPGLGNIDVEKIVKTFKIIDFNGYMSFEIKQNPDCFSAAKGCADTLKKLI